jgi:hypothetical protein
MRAQISIEYLVIMGVTLGILIPAVFFFYTYSKSDTGSTTSAQINEIGLRAVSTVKGTYALGTGAWQTLEFSMPESVTRVYVNNTELVFVYDTSSGESTAVFFSNVNMTSTNPDGNISQTHPGLTKYRFTSQGGTVLITETT